MIKGKIAIIADVPNWSFDILAKLIKKELSAEYQIDIFYCVTDFNKNLFDILESTKNYDVIHFLARKLLMQFEDPNFIKKVNSKNYNYNEYVKNCVKKITVSVNDEVSINDPDTDYTKIFRLYCNKYFVCSKKLVDLYSTIPNCPAPWGEIRDTINTDIFIPNNLERFQKDKIEHRPLVIGWVGNSNWTVKNNSSIDYKGLHTILKPAIEELKQEGYNIVPHYADVSEKYRNSIEMQQYYSEIDIYICVSLTEGTPLPVLESMCCGVPIITTNVGVVPEVLGAKQSQFILQERSISALKEKIKYLYNNKYLLKELSDENIKEGIKNSSKTTVEKYIKLFDSIISPT